MSKLGNENWTIVKRLFKYLCGITYHAICYQGKAREDKALNVHRFVDVEWVGDLDHRISTSGYAFNLFAEAINWMRKKHIVVELSTIEDEYMESTNASIEVIWLQRLC